MSLVIESKIGSRLEPKKISRGYRKENGILKPIMNNTCTVQVVDSLTGRLKDEQVAKNSITNYYNRIAILDQFMAPVFSNSANRIPSDLPWNALYLSDSTEDIDPDMKYLPGNIIGYANRDLAHISVSPYRGTVNESETVKNGDLDMTVVFDWPTHAANGSFQTVYWTALYAGLTYNRAYQPPGAYCVSNTQSVPVSASTGPCHIEGGWMYYTSSSAVYRTRRGSTTTFTRTSYDYLELLADLSADDSAIGGVGKSGDYWYVYGGQYDKIYKYDSDWNLVTSFSLSTSYMVPTYSSWLVKSDKIHAVKWNSSSSVSLFRFDLDGTLEATTELFGSGGNFDTFANLGTNYMSLHSDEDNLIVMAPPKTVSPNYGAITNQACLLIVDPLTHAVISDMPGIINGDTTPNQASVWNPEIHCMESPSYYTFPVLHPLAAVKLAAPVTKTSADFLKISYNLSLDYTQIP